MTDPTNNNQAPTFSSTIAALFSPATLAALRYTLAALSPLVALFGFTGLTPDKIDIWVAYAKTFGTAALAVAALVGIVMPLVVAIFGILSSTVKKQIARVRELANNPQLATEEAQKALVAATAAIAQNPSIVQSLGAQQALVSATISLDGVQTIVADKKLADSVPSESVVAAQ